MVTALDKLDHRQRVGVARTVTDPEMPMLTLEDLGVLRAVEEHDGRVEVAITPTYSGCPAMATMRDDLVHRLTRRGVRRRPGAGRADAGLVERLDQRRRPSQAGRARHLAARGRARGRCAGRRSTCCPPGARSPARAAARPSVELTSEFGATACKALYRCTSCLEPFEHVKEI